MPERAEGGSEAGQGQSAAGEQLVISTHVLAAMAGDGGAVAAARLSITTSDGRNQMQDIWDPVAAGSTTKERGWLGFGLGVRMRR